MKFLNLLFVMVFAFAITSCGEEAPKKEEVKTEETAKEGGEEVKEEGKTEAAPETEATTEGEGEAAPATEGEAAPAEGEAKEESHEGHDH